MYVSLFLHIYIHTHTYIYVNYIYIYIYVSHALVCFTSCFLLLKKLYNKLTLLSGTNAHPVLDANVTSHVKKSYGSVEVIFLIYQFEVTDFVLVTFFFPLNIKQNVTLLELCPEKNNY